MNIKIHDIWPEYELIDSGFEKKLERFGELILIRPEPSAIHKPALQFNEWEKAAHAEFIQTGRTSGTWRSLKDHPEEWNIQLQEKSEHLSLKLKKNRV